MKSIRKNAVLNMIRVLMGMMFPLISFPYASRILGPEGVGKVDFSISITAYFVLMASLGISTYGIRQGATVRENRQELSIFVQEILIINLASTVISYLFFFLTITQVDKLKDYTSLLLICGLNIGLNTLGMDWLYGALEEYGYITIRSIVFQCISLGMLFLLVQDADDYMQYAFVTIFATAGSNILNIIHARKFVTWKKKIHQYNFRRHIKPIMTIFGLNLACNIYMNLDKTMLGIICGDSEVGLYTAALKINRIVLQLLLSIGTVVVARLSYYHANNKADEFQALFLKVFNLVLMFAIPATVGLWMLSKPTLLFISGNQYISADVTTKLLSLIIIIIGMSNLMSVQLFIPMGKERYSLIASSIAAIVNLTFNTFLIKPYGKNGAAFSTVLAETAALIICIYYSRKLISYDGVLKNIIQFVCASICIIPVYYLVNTMAANEIILMFTTIFAGIIVYGVVLLLFKNSVIMDSLHLLKTIKEKIRWK